MVCTTTSTLENAVITEYKGIVTGEIVSGVDFIKDFGASFRNFFGGRSSGYEEELQKSREFALNEMQNQAMQLGANAVVGVKIDYEAPVQGMLMVSATGTAVVAKSK